MRARHRRIVRLVSAALGQGPDDDDRGWQATWNLPVTRVHIWTCWDCAQWWLVIEGHAAGETYRVRLTRRMRLALARVRP